jgi:hypothetical protein
MTGLQAVTTLLVVTPRTRAALAAEAVLGRREDPRVGPVGAARYWSGRIPVGSADPQTAGRIPVGPVGVVAGATAGAAPVSAAVPTAENIYHFYQKCFQAITIMIINLEITKLCYNPLNTDASGKSFMEKGCLPASKLVKEAEKQHIYCKKLLWFLCIVYSMGCWNNDSKKSVVFVTIFVPNVPQFAGYWTMKKLRKKTVHL